MNILKDRKFKLGDLIEEKILKKSSSDNELITFVGMEDVSEDGKLINQNVMKFSELKNGLTYFERKDVLVAKITPRFENSKGACLDNLKTEKGYGSTEFHVLRSNSKSIPRYIYYITQLKRFRKQLEGQMIGTAGHRRVPMEAIKNFNLEILHPLPEQKAIAKVLSDIDELIESIEKLIHKKKQIKQGAMQELLTGKKRLAGFSGEWEVKRLGELGVTYSGLSGKKKEDFNNGNSYYITFLNVLNNPVIDLKQVEKVRVSKWENQNLVRKGDIFFNTSSETPEEVGMCSVLMEDKPNLYLNSFCFGYRLYDGSKCDALYLTSYLRSDLGRKMFSTIAQGSTRYNLSKKEFNNIAIPLPPLPEQKAIAQILSDMDAEIEALEKKLDKYRKIKEGMMEKLLTGQVRLV